GGAPAQPERRLARDRAPDEIPVDAAPDVLDHAGVLVAQHERRRPREQSLRRVDVGAADPRGAHGDDGLPAAGGRIGRLVDGEVRTAAPGGDLHGEPPTMIDRARSRRRSRGGRSLRAPGPAPPAPGPCAGPEAAPGDRCGAASPMRRRGSRGTSAGPRPADPSPSRARGAALARPRTPRGIRTPDPRRWWPPRI